MPNKRPGSATVTLVAVLHFIMGGFTLIYALCGGIGLVQILAAGTPAAAAPAPNAPPDNAAMAKYMIDNVAGFMAVQVVNVVAALAFGVLLIVAGVGLLKGQAWARWASLGYGIVGILLNLFLIFHQATAVGPAQRAFMEKEVQRLTDPAQKQAFTIAAQVTPAIGTATAVVCILYPLLVTLLMLLPGVAAHFRQGAPPPDDRDRDDYDDRRDRRRDEGRDRDDYREDR